MDSQILEGVDQTVTEYGPRGAGAPRVSIVVVNYNGAKYIEACLSSLLKQQYTDYEIIVVDNGSEDGSADYVERHFPGVRLIRAGQNLGFGVGNNLGALSATGEFLAFLNMDTVVEPDWLEPLVQTLEENPEVGLVTGKILLLNDPDHINTCGNDIHFAGFGYLRGWLAPSQSADQAETVNAVSGAAFAVSRSLFLELGGFDDAFSPAYVEDTDLSWRARLMGYQCRYVPESIIYHDYAASFSPQKFYLLERNRYQMLLKNLRWRTLWLLLPVLLLAEIVSWGFSLLSGPAHIRAKMTSHGWLIANWSNILRRRQVVQQSRRVSDREILSTASLKLAAGQTGDGFEVKVCRWVLDPLFYLWHRVYLGVTRQIPEPAAARLSERVLQDVTG